MTGHKTLLLFAFASLWGHAHGEESVSTLLTSLPAAELRLVEATENADERATDMQAVQSLDKELAERDKTLRSEAERKSALIVTLSSMLDHWVDTEEATKELDARLGAASKAVRTQLKAFERGYREAKKHHAERLRAARKAEAQMKRSGARSALERQRLKLALRGALMSLRAAKRDAGGYIKRVKRLAAIGAHFEKQRLKVQERVFQVAARKDEALALLRYAAQDLDTLAFEALLNKSLGDSITLLAQWDDDFKAQEVEIQATEKLLFDEPLDTTPLDLKSLSAVDAFPSLTDF